MLNVTRARVCVYVRVFVCIFLKMYITVVFKRKQFKLTYKRLVKNFFASYALGTLVAANPLLCRTFAHNLCLLLSLFLDAAMFSVFSVSQLKSLSLSSTLLCLSVSFSLSFQYFFSSPFTFSSNENHTPKK